MIRIKLAALMNQTSLVHGHTKALTVNEVASGTGIHRATLSKMLHHVGYNANFDSLDRLCTYFGVTVDQMVEHVPDNTDTQETPQPSAPETPETFVIGGVSFTPIKAEHPRIPNTTIWLVQINESGEVWEPGTGGVSTESRPKLKADLQELWERAAKCDEAAWRRQLQLDPKAKTKH